jgi:hypothetical protein
VLEATPAPVQADLALSSIELSVARLLKQYRKEEHGRVFFVVYTPEWRLYERDCNRHPGYSALFFQPAEHLSNPYWWDIVMYSTSDGEAVVRLAWRPEG